MAREVYVAGVGMIPFAKPGKSDPYHVMGAAAARKALDDARVPFALVEQAYVGYVFGDSCSGQRALYGVGLSSIPIVNVNNNCSTGSTALFLARQAVESGAVECALALGFEQMVPGAIKKMYTDRPTPLDEFAAAVDRKDGIDPAAPMAPQYFAAAGRQYMRDRGAKPSTFAKISVKARKHAARNPFALFRDPVTEEEVLASPNIVAPLTRLQCCPPTCGAAAAVLCSRDFAVRHGLDQRVVIAGQAMTTDVAGTFDAGDMLRVVGYDMARRAAAQVYEAMKLQVEVLRDQQRSLRNTRNDITGELANDNTKGVDREGLEGRLKSVDARIGDLDKQLSQAQAQEAIAAGVPGAYIEPPR
ncbi:MAG: hypothetical protein ABI647_03230, partial [Gemmatimonadota bacterium]